MEREENGWKEWRKYVLNTLDKLESRIEKNEDEIVQNKINISNLLTRAKIYGSLSGFIVSAILSLIVGLTIYFVSTNIDIESIENINKINRQQIQEEYGER